MISDDGCTVLGPGGELLTGSQIVTQHDGGRAYRVRADGFWQVHPGAAETLTAAVLDGLNPKAGEQVADLYCGCGLFAGALVDAGCRVTGIEASRSAHRTAKLNVPQARFHAMRWTRPLSALQEDGPDRPGSSTYRRLCRCGEAAGGAGTHRDRLCACDPAALARDLPPSPPAATGWNRLRAFDLFPMTHHMECVAVLRPH